MPKIALSKSVPAQVSESVLKSVQDQYVLAPIRYVSVSVAVRFLS